jgi:hypothetical protein
MPNITADRLSVWFKHKTLVEHGPQSLLRKIRASKLLESFRPVNTYSTASSYLQLPLFEDAFK